MQTRKNDPKQKLYEDKVISINRVTKVKKGGRDFRFAATVVVGNKKGRVGLGTGKSREVPDAVNKAIKSAENNIIDVSIIDERTISHDAIGSAGAAKVMIKPAKAGTGLVAGGSVRAVLELAGVKDIVSKSLGSNTKINVARATIEALKSQKSIEHVAELRGKKVEEIL